jgi:two-component system sensor histidine kinase TctE
MKSRGWNVTIFRREQRSLFGEILDWMLTPLLLLWPISLALTWLVAQGLANKPFDRALVYNVQALAQQVRVGADQRAQFNLPQPASEILRADETDLVYYQVKGTRGEFLSGERDLPEPPKDEERGNSYEVRIRDDEMRGMEVRVAWTWIRLDTAGHRPALVQVAETREKRSVLAAEIIKGVMLPQFAILPLAVLLVWLALVRGIKPLSQLEERIRARKSDDLSPLDDKAVPMEVAPLVVSVNDLLDRLKDSIATQKRFLADAAHQLKTPLAGLRMQADLAQRSGASEDELKRSLQQIGRASVQATHTVNQLLALARAEGGGASLPQQQCNMVSMASEVLLDCFPRAADKGIDLGYDGAEADAPGVTVKGNPTLLKEMVRNLVENAIHYTPSTSARPGVVTLRVLVDPYSKVLVLQVEDNGPGIPPAERELVFQPFYRALGTNVDGSGLGLPIVREIAQRHGATITVDAANPGQTPPGACFTLRFGLPD